MVKSDKKRKRTISCGTVVYRYPNDSWGDTEILLVKQFFNKDNWGIPKGHIESGESFEECAVRETREEAGVDVEIGLRLRDVTSLTKNEEKTVISFLAQQTCDREPSSNDQDSEVADARWFKIRELPKIHVYQQSLISEVLDVLFSQFKSRIKNESKDS